MRSTLPSNQQWDIQTAASKMKVIFLLSLAVLSATAAFKDVHERHIRAIGGQQFGRGRWPWLALMKATIVTQRLFGILPISHYHLYCGGVLVSRRWVLTAAHCFDNGDAAADPGNWKTRLGTVRLRPSASQRVLDVLGRIFDQDDFRQWELDVDRIVTHPGYNSSSLYSDDLALVKLSRDAPTTDLIRPIQLPSVNQQGFPTVGQICFTKGWGCTTRGGNPSSRAREIALPIYSSRRCGMHYNMPVRSRRLCAGYRNRGIGVCNGDSGSPLVCSSNGQFTLAGIVSFASRNRPASFPAVFSRVQAYIPWIQRVID